MVRHNPCLPQNGSTKSLQNGEAQPLHYQEFSLQNGFGANEPLKKRQPLQNGSGQPDFFRPLKSIEFISNIPKPRTTYRQKFCCRYTPTTYRQERNDIHYATD